jgi:hypothetical protein
MKLGFARINITPGFPVPLAGYITNRISQGVHDKLYARALFFEGGECDPLVLLQLDLLELDRVCLDKIYQILKNDSKENSVDALLLVDKNNILICATHTHSGFGGIFDTAHGINRELIPLFGEHNSALVDFLVTRCVEAITIAACNCVETTIKINRGTIKGLGTNRHNPDIPCDNSLFVMEFVRLDGKKILLYNLSCHPTVLNGENLFLSADFPGAVAGKLEAIPDAYDMVVFVNGSAGDMSTRFTRKESSFEECNRYANIIVDALSGLKNGVFLSLKKADLRYHTFSLQKAAIPDPQKARENLQNALQGLEELKGQNADAATLRKAASLIEGAQINLLKASYVDEVPGNITVETGILRINDTTIVCSPFELFSSLALILKEKKQVECFGYVNCLEGYLADCDAWNNLDYEALSGNFKYGEGERYIELVSALI